MNLPSIWQQILSARGVEKHLLLTLDLSGGDPMVAPHLALQPNARCYSTNLGTFVAAASGRTVPFLPYLTTWPAITRTLTIQDRTAVLAEPTFTILAASGLAALLRDRGSALGLTARVDLWCRRVTLEQCIPLLAGVVTDAQIDRRTAGVALTIADGDPNKSVVWPPGPIGPADFPNAPDAVIDITSRQTVIGAYPDPIPCVQIDQAGREFYVMDPPGAAGPTTIQKDGEPITADWVTDVVEAPVSRFRYRRLTFSVPMSEIASGISSVITCSGGVGVADTDAISFYLGVAGVPLSRAAAAALAFTRGDSAQQAIWALRVTNNQTGNALDIVRQRLIPQTPWAFTQHLGRAELIPVDVGMVGTPSAIGIGNGLLFRTTAQAAQTSTESVFNAFEFICGQQGSQLRLRRDTTHGSSAITALLTRSEAQYNGRRFVQVPLPDIAVQIDEDGSPIGCAAGEYLADLFARTHAFSRVPHTYQATWLDGLDAELGELKLLTDSGEAYADRKVRVVGISITQSGPQLTFETEDA